MSEFQTKAVKTVPPINRKRQGSKYDVLFEETENTKSGILEVIFDSTEQSQTRCGYLRRLAPEGWRVEQRGQSVFILTEEAAREQSEA